MRSTTKAMVAKARTLRRQMSPPEVILWQHLRAHPDGLKFRRQHPIGRYIADSYCPSAKLVIEIDGDAHDFEARAARDAVRDEKLSAVGFTVLRIPARDVFADAGTVLDGILAAACEKLSLHHSLRERSPSP